MKRNFYHLFIFIRLIKNNKENLTLKRIKKIAYCLLGMIFTYGCFLFICILSNIHEKPLSSSPNIILVLGARIYGTEKGKAYPGNVLKTRLDTTLAYIKKHSSTTKIIVCGGKGALEPTTEASVMATYLNKHGIPRQKLIQEKRSTRTKENIQYAMKLVNLDHALLITSDFHLYRSKWLAKQLGIHSIDGLPAMSKNSSIIKNYSKEILSLGYAFIFDNK